MYTILHQVTNPKLLEDQYIFWQILLRNCLNSFDTFVWADGASTAQGTFCPIAICVRKRLPLEGNNCASFFSLHCLHKHHRFGWQLFKRWREIERFFGEKAAKSKIPSTVLETRYWLAICAKCGRFPALRYLDQFSSSNEKHSLRNGQFSVQLCAENHCNLATLIAFFTKFAKEFCHTVFASDSFDIELYEETKKSLSSKNAILALQSC